MQQMYQHGLIGPLLALVGWTFVMWFWVFAVRIPAVARLKLDVQESARTGSLPLPPAVRWVGDNYNHLHEQPTLFYALALAAQVTGVTDPITIGIGWTYVALRVVHSLIQATVNIIAARFTVFIISSLVLLALLVRIVMAILSI